MYSEYQIKAAMIKVLEQALSDTEVSGYEVLARNVQTMTHDNDVVLVDKISTRRHGFQSHTYKKCRNNADGELCFWKSEEWIEEIIFQISVCHKRRVSDTIDSMTGEDVLKRLQMWFNSHHGARSMRERKDVPIAPVHVFQARSQTYNDDSDNHQIDEQFDISVIVLQTWDTKPRTLDGWEVETHPI